jgi:hypothetical protein
MPELMQVLGQVGCAIEADAISYTPRRVHKQRKGFGLPGSRS